MKHDLGPNTWTTTRRKRYGVAIYNFKDYHKSNSDKYLNLEIGEVVHISEECAGWFRGYSLKNKTKLGIFPCNVVVLKPFKIDNEGLSESIIPDEDPTSREVVQVVREWHELWKQLYLNRQNQLLDRITCTVEDLIELRRQLISETLTSDQIREVKFKIVPKIDVGNSLLGLDLVPRLDGERVDPQNISPVELYMIHRDASERAQSESSYKRSSAASNTGSSQSNVSPTTNSNSHFLHLHIRDAILNVVPVAIINEEILELSFALFDATSQNRMQYLSERFIVKTPPTGPVGFKNSPAILSQSSGVFTDIGNADLGRDLYLVVHLFRIGRIQFSDNKSSKTLSSSTVSQSGATLNGSSPCKRPLGVGIISLNEIIKSQGTEKDFSLRFYFGNDSEFHQIHELLIRKQTVKLNQLSGASIQLTLRFISNSLSRLRKESPLVYKNTVFVQKRGFPDIIMPGDVRNDLYVNLEGGDFEKGGKSIAKNIEASLKLVSASDGHVIPASISGGSGEEPQTCINSVVLYHNNSPRWNEMMKILIPLEIFDGAHIRIEYRHCSSKSRDKQLFGFSFIPLTDEMGTIMKNGSHELYIYKCEDPSKLADVNSYIFLPWGPLDRMVTSHSLPSSCPFGRSSKETTQISTLLCSTKLTQNSDLLGLLKWRDNPELVQESLHRMMRLNGEEIVKFLQDILDSLFAMFATHDGYATSQTEAVFNVLIHIFLLLEDPKYSHFKPVLDTYISGHFSAALVYKELMACLIECADSVQNPAKHDGVVRCFRCMDQLFKLIIQSRLLYSRATGEANEELFKKELYALFARFTVMLGTVNHLISSHPSQLGNNYQTELISIQVAFISNFPATFEQISRVLSKKELARIVNATISGLSYLDHVPQLVVTKLNCILQTVQNDIFHDRDARLELLEPLMKHVSFHMSKKQETQICSNILSEILTFLHQETKRGNGTNFEEVESISMCILEVLTRCTLDFLNSSPINRDHAHLFSANLISLLRMMEDTHYSQFLNSKDRLSKKEFLIRTFFVFKAVQTVYPSQWMVMRMVVNNVILYAIQELSLPLKESEFLKNEFDHQLWTSYFTLSVSFLTQQNLQLEEFSAAKRESILDKYADMRVLMGFQILSMWEHLSARKVHFIPCMVAPFLEVTLVPEKELRKATLPIFYDMMDAEYQANGNFKQVESHLIDKLDMLVSANKGDDDYRLLFNTIILSRIHQNNPIWKEEGVYFTNSITKLLELLLDYRQVMEGEDNREKRMSCTFNLLNFYHNEINRKEMYIRYIYKLCDLHLTAPENWTEAAFTLKLRADLLQWSYNLVPRENIYDEEKEWQRKETLYLRIIEYFDKGKTWEEAIKLCKELAYFYERKLFDYAKLSSILKMEARFLDNILTQLRPEPEYFRVGFYGLDFPLFLRNKVFVYRGQEYERIAAFTQRLQNEFPKAAIMSKNSPPEQEILNSAAQFIQICNVKPVPESRIEFEGHIIPEKVLSYYQVNDIRNYTYDRPNPKGSVDRENEFKSLWIERTTLTLATPLPGILRWLQVYSLSSIELSPLEYACETVENMNKELSKLITQYTFEPNMPISPLSMRLQGVIEAAVNGGIAKYQEAFFNLKFIQANIDHTDKIQHLRQLIAQKVKLLEGGLSLHGRLAPPDVQPLHKRLVERFQLMRHSVYEANNSQVMFDLDSRKPAILSQPLPPIPHSMRGFSTDVLQAIDCKLGFNLADMDEQIYAVPHESSVNVSGSSGRPRSACLDSIALSPSQQNVVTLLPLEESNTNGSHISRNNNSNSVQRSRSIPRNHHLQNDGCHMKSTSIDVDDPHAPPLPPRSGTLERQSSSVCSNSERSPPPPPPPPKTDMDSLEKPNNPPILPRRGTKKHPPPPPPVSDQVLTDGKRTNNETGNGTAHSPPTISSGPPPLPSKRHPMPSVGPPSIPVPPAPQLIHKE